jgi:cell wall-associated NlpC family hydrolase
MNPVMTINRFPAICITFAAITLCIGCAPSIRYSSKVNQAGAVKAHVYVPRNWDYRKSYAIPPSRLSSIIDSYIGVPYRYGGTSRKGIDCSGLVFLVFKELAHAKMPRSSRQLARLGRPVNRGGAKPGDLVFFRGGMFNGINHVGIMVGQDRFAHASTKKGVMYSRLDEEYFTNHFAFIKRVF